MKNINKILLEIFIGCFTIISIIYGLSSDVITDSGYNWYNPFGMINYSLKQISINELNDTVYGAEYFNPIDLISSAQKLGKNTNHKLPDDNSTYYFLFIIDQTLSTTESDLFKTQTQDARKAIIDSLKAEYKIKEDIIPKLETKSLVTIYLIKSLYLLQDSLTQNNKIGIGLYYGCRNLKFKSLKNYFNLPYHEYWHNVKNNFDTIASSLVYSERETKSDSTVNRYTAVTDFKTIFEQIKYIFIDKIDKKNNPKLILTIISDFYQDSYEKTGTSLFELQSEIKEFSENNIYQINLLKLPVYPNNHEQLYKIDILTEKLKKYFSRTYCYDFDIVKLVEMNKNKIINKFNEIITPTYDEKEQEIKLYYPFKADNSRNVARTHIKINSQDTDAYYSFLLTSKSNIEEKNFNFYYTKGHDNNNKKLIFLSLEGNELTAVEKLSKDQFLSVKYLPATDVNRYDLSLEIFKENKNNVNKIIYKSRIPIAFIKRMPESNAHLLILFMLLLLLTPLLLFILWLRNFISNSLKSCNKVFIYKYSYIFILIIPLLVDIYLLVNKIPWFSFIILNIYIIFFYFYSDITETIKRLLTKGVYNVSKINK